MEDNSVIQRTKLGVETMLSMTPEVFLERISRPDEVDSNVDFDYEAQKSFALLASSSTIRMSVIANPRIQRVDAAWQEFYQPSEKLMQIQYIALAVDIKVLNMARLLSAPTLRLGLVISGLPGSEASPYYPLTRKSATRWTFEGFVSLPKAIPDITVNLISDFWGDIGRAVLSGTQLMGAKSFSIEHPTMITEPLINGYSSTGIELSFVVWPLLMSSEISCEPPLDPFFRTGNLDDLNKAIDSLKTSLCTLPNDSIIKLTTRLFLSEAYLTRAQLGLGGACQQDIHNSIIAAEAALDAITSGNNPDFQQHHLWALRALGASLAGRFALSRDREDIDRAIKALRRATAPREVVAIPEALNSSFEKESCALAWSNLGAALFDRHRALNVAEDLAESIVANRKALELIPNMNKHKPNLLCSLGSCLTARYAQERSLDELEEGQGYIREGLHLQNPNHAGTSVWLCNLGTALRCRYCHSGNLGTLNEAISILQRALRNPAPACLVDILDQLSGCYIQHYEHTSEIQSLHEAIELCEKALRATPKSAQRPNIITLKNGVHGYRYLFTESKDTRHLCAAISIQRIVVDLTSETDEFALPIVLGQLGSDYVYLFQTSREAQDIESGINALKDALEKSSPSRPEFPWILGNVGKALRDRFSLRWDKSDVDEGIIMVEKALSLLDVDDITRPQHDQCLADSLMVRFTAFDDPVDMDRALAHYSKVACSVTATPMQRLEGAQGWARWALKYRGAAQSLEAFENVVRLVTLVAGMENTVKRRHDLLSRYSGEILKAAATAFAAERVDKAVEWLEEGRGLVWAQLISLRTPLSKLQSHDPVLGERFQKVCRQLEIAASSHRFADPTERRKANLDQKISTHERASEHLRLSEERECILDAIRGSGIPGLENFLRPLSCSSRLDSLPESGLVVMINVHEMRCDAVVLRKGLDRPLHIPLPNFSLQQASALVEKLKTSLGEKNLRMRGDDGDRAMRPMTDRHLNMQLPIEGILKNLWKAVVKPILVDCLGLERRSDTPALRIWWCPTGPLTFLPLHAAGVYRGENATNVANYAVSSYIPTLTVLAEQVKKPRAIPANNPGLLLVSVPTVAGCSPIPGTTVEVEQIRKQVSRLKIRTLRLEGENATVAAGIKEMQNYSCVHLACHAIQDMANPLQSAFRFRDGRLELSKIIESDLKSADFAFLSACQTSTGAETLSEEAVHLAAGMLAAGYRSVVATMWSIQDRYAPQLADDFYKELFGREEGDIDGTQAAFALHRAVERLRGESFLAWVPYVHFGL